MLCNLLHELVKSVPLGLFPMWKIKQCFPSRLFTPNFTAQSCDLWIEAALGAEFIGR